MYILFAILIFGFLIFIHELGHFLTAKALDVQVNEFSICMGPAIVKKQKGETLYALRCIPVGGYCAMEGEDEESDNPRAFTSKVWWKRLIILAAGSFMNFLTGLAVLAMIYSCVAGFSTAKISGSCNAGSGFSPSPASIVNAGRLNTCKNQSLKPALADSGGTGSTG